MEELHSKASKIEESYCSITTLRREPQPLYGEGGCHHDSNAMDVDHLTLSLVKHACNMHENYCFICHKEHYSTRNHPDYNRGHPIGSWNANPEPS